MEQSVNDVFSEQIMQFGFEKFAITYDSIKKLGEFENYIFQGLKETKEVIIRFTHSSHRSYEQILSEIDWVQFLKKQDINVYKHFHSIEGRLLEKIEAVDGSFFYICCYEKLPGKQITLKDVTDYPNYIEMWGAAIGKIHKATRLYRPTTVVKRLEWYEEELINAEKFILVGEEHAANYCNQIVSEIKKLKKDESNYGLIHSDLHRGNFTIEENELYMFDFDDCSYHWFASDIAIPLYYTMLTRSYETEEGKQDFANYFMNHFLQGYRYFHEVSLEQLKTIPLFLKLRDITLLSVMFKKYNLEHLTEQKRLFDNVYERIQRQDLIVELDWNEFC